MVPSPKPDSNHAGLGSISAISPSDAWAVGNYYNRTVERIYSLAEHWDGRGWAIVPTPNSPGYSKYLNGVSSISGSDAWSVGFYNSGGDLTNHSLIEHWNGSVWAVVPSPNASNDENHLLGVSAISASDAWAVGWYYGNDLIAHTLVEHWNGHVWTVVPSPNSSNEFSYLYVVSAISPADAWAAGDRIGSDNVTRTLVEHWNGRVWTVVPSPSPGSKISDVSGISAVSSSDVWIAGTYAQSDNISRTLTERWNGRTWAVIPSPNASVNSNFLSGISSTAISDAWAVGGYYDGNNARIHTLIEHWKC